MHQVERQRKLKLVSLVDHIGPAGGAERFVREVMMRVDGDRFERILCVSRWSPQREADPAVRAILDELEEAGVQFIGIRRRFRFQVWSWWRLVALMRRNSIDILHSHKFGSNVWGATLAPLARVPVFVAHEHTWSFRGKPWRRFLDRELIARRAAAFIAVSAMDRRRMIEIERIDPDRVVVIPTASPSLKPRRGREEMRRELGIGEPCQVLGAICVLRPQKAIGTLVRAMALLKEEFPNARLLVAGDGPERSSLEDLIRSLNLGSTAFMLGRRDDVGDVLQAIDIGVLSSDFEGTPLALMEYMAAGKAVVATRVGGVPDMVQDGVHGLLVEPGSPKQLSSAIAALLRAPDRAAEMGRLGQERIAREFDIDAVVRRVEQLYEELRAAAANGDRG